jgi:branched-chain amino acid transport system substrate-binding protein
MKGTSRTKRALVVAITGALALTVAACGSDDDSSSDTVAATSAASEGTETTAAGTTAASSETTAASAEPAEPTGDPWVIAAMYPMSGPTAPFYTSTLVMLDEAVTLINDNGGIAGRPLEIEKLDSAGTPQQATTVLQSYLSSNTPQAVMPGPVTALVQPVLPILTEKGIFATAGTAAKELNDPAQYPTYFPVTPTTTQIEEALVAHLESEGFSKPAFMGPDNASGASALAAFEEAAKAKNMTVSSVLVDPAAVDATAQLAKLKDSSPDVLIFTGFGAFGGVALKSKAKMNWDIPMYGDETFAANDLGKLATPEDLKDLKLQFFQWSVKGDPGSETPTATALLDAFAANGGLSTAFWANALTFNAVVNAKIAGDAAGPDATGEELTKALEAVQEIPENVKDLFFAGPELGYSSTNHTPLWQASDFSFVNAGPLENGLMVVPAS